MDGKPGTIRPAWLAFRAVFVEPGTHRVVFRYEPAGWVPGLAMTGVGGLVALVMVVWPRRMPRVGDGHEDEALSGWWMWALAGVVLLVLVGSVVKVEEGGVGVQSRWEDRWHPFTWGAGLESIKPPPPLPEFD